MATDNTYDINLLLIGSGGVGKSSLIRKLLTGRFKEKYNATIGAKVYELILNTTRGEVTIQVWDTAGQEKFGSLRDTYYTKADMCILMFDLTSRTTYNSVPQWYRDITNVKKSLPTVIVGNKIDLERTVQSKAITFPKRKKLKYFETSVKDDVGIIEPFVELLQQYFDDSELQLVECE